MRPALRTFFRLTDQWGLTAAEARRLLGMPPMMTFWLWRLGSGRGIDQATLERISYLLGIYKALHTIFPDAARADAWIRRANQAPGFGGQSALDRMLNGDMAELRAVRTYLDAQL